MLELYASCSKVANRNANVDQEDELHNLSTYKECLDDFFKENEKNTQEMKNALEDKLFLELSVRFKKECNEGYHKASIDDQLLYDVCGYVCKARKYLHDECDECAKTLFCDETKPLPDNLRSLASFTLMKDMGGLLYPTLELFESFKEIESVLTNFFSNDSHVYKLDAYQDCIDMISEKPIHPLFCDNHREDSLPFFIMEFIHVRFFFESKRFENTRFGKNNSKIHSNMKQSKVK